MTSTHTGGLRAYAAHRKASGLPGHTHGAVQRAIDSGRLTDSVSTIDGVTVIDFAAADAEWAARTDPTRAQRTARNAEAEATTIRRLHFRAKTLEQKYRSRAGQLVDAVSWTRAVAAHTAEIRQAVGTIPQLWAGRRPGVSAEAIALAVRAVTDALNNLDPIDARWPPAPEEANPVTLGPQPAPAGVSEPSSVAEASAREKGWQALLQELDYYQGAGDLLNAADVGHALSEAAANVRSHLLGVPAKVKQWMPDTTYGDLVTLDEVIRETLNNLADGKGATAA